MPNTSLDDLSPNTRDLAEQSLTWSEARWDPEGAFLSSRPVGKHDGRRRSRIILLPFDR